MCVENAVTDEAHSFRTKEEFHVWFDSLDRRRVLVGHNCVAFDIPVVNVLFDCRIGIARVVDTFVLSMLYSPSLQGGHSLEAWGDRLRCPKLVHKDFSAYSEEMLRYCQQDVRLTKKLFTALTARMRAIGFTEKGAEIETLHWHIIQNKQRRHGFPFDAKRAHILLAELRQRAEEIRQEIYKIWPPVLQPVREFKRAFKQDGTRSTNFERHLAQYPKIELDGSGGYTAYDWVEFNLASPPQRISKLLDAGWQPTSFTKRTKKGGGGNPQVDEDSLNKFAETSGNEAGKLLAKWVVINSRANAIENWLDSYNEKTGAIHGNLWLAGTLRYRHDNPNSTNIPAVRSGKNGILRGEQGLWTYECRDLWTSGDISKYSLVGVDAKGIQLRVLANYLGDEEFNKAILSEDPHSYNQNAWGLDTRAKAKTILYAIVMGAGDGRVASEASISLSEAKATKKQLFDRVPGFPRLIGRLQQEWKKSGRIRLCDGTPILVPKDYRVIPYLLQGDESRIMRLASILLDREIRRNKIDARKVGDIHDEWQFVVLTEHVEKFIELSLAVFPIAGRELNYNIIIEGDAKVGKTWAETH